MTSTLSESWATDVCALPLVRRMSAWLDRDPAELIDGHPLPRGWQTLLFNTPARQSDLRTDGAVSLSVALPDSAFPRLMLGGRRQTYLSDIPIGARVRRRTFAGPVIRKSGRSGAFDIVSVEHRIFVESASEPALIEEQDYLFRPAAVSSGATTPSPTRLEPQAAEPVSPSSACGEVSVRRERVLIPDERLLFRYSALTDNPHRIHYDLRYATQGECYPELVVNGSIPFLFLLEMFRIERGAEPRTAISRNLAPMYCNSPLTLRVSGGPESGWRLWAENSAGALAFDAWVS